MKARPVRRVLRHQIGFDRPRVDLAQKSRPTAAFGLVQQRPRSEAVGQEDRSRLRFNPTQVLHGRFLKRRVPMHNPGPMAGAAGTEPGLAEQGGAV